MNYYSEILPNGLTRGHYVRSIIDGFEGMLTGISYVFNGSILAAVKPKAIANVRQDAYFVDYHTLEKIDDGVADKLEPVETDLGFVLGEEVQDRVSGLKGTITEIVIQINGCRDVVITPKTDFGSNSPQLVTFSQHRIDRISKKKTVKTQTNTRGGCVSYKYNGVA